MALGNVSPGDPHAKAHNDERAKINELEGIVGRPNRQSDRAFFPMQKALLAGNFAAVVMADSKGEGTGLAASTDRWLYKLQKNLRQMYGSADQGEGYIPAKYATFYEFSDTPKTSGSTVGVTQDYGLGTRALTLNAGSNVTFKTLPFVSGVPLVVHWTRQSGGGELEVVTGGTVRATINTNGGLASMTTEVTIPAGNQAVMLRPKATTAVKVEGIYHQTAKTGIKIIDGTLSGGTFRDFGVNLKGNGHWNAAAKYEPQGVFMAFGANDMSQRTPDQMAADAKVAVDKALASRPQAGVVILMGTERTQDAETGKVRGYEEAMRKQFGDSPSVSVMYESDLWLPKAGVDYTWGGPTGWLVDTVHTSADAHTEIALYLAENLQPSAPKVPTTPGEVGALPDTYVPPNQSWSQIADKPTVFPPGGHSHPWSEISGKPDSFPVLAMTTGTNLNDLMSTGTYMVTSTAWTTTALNFPINGFAGLIEVMAQGVFLTQRATYYYGTSNLFSVWVRTYFNDKWMPWREFKPWVEPSTGWRDITSLIVDGSLDPSAPGRLLIRRENGFVTVRARLLRRVASGPRSVGNAGLIEGANPLPHGFRPERHVNAFFSKDNAITTYYQFAVWSGIYVSVFSRPQGGFWVNDDPITGEVTYATKDSWPTTLPGTPV